MSKILGDSRVRTEGFERDEYVVNGIRTVVYSAGHGETVVYFHGAGTFHGFDFARDWTEDFRVVIPYHPGFGESQDDMRIDSMHDYVRHYANLFDRMGLNKFNLVGCSMGGRMAAQFAADHGALLDKLVLVCPAGLDVPAHPMTNLADIPPGELLDYLIEDVSVLEPFVPTWPDPEFGTMRARETAAVGRILRNGSLVDPALPASLARIDVATFLLWGREDRVIPAAQAQAWAALLPRSTVRVVAGAGHLILDESPQARGEVKAFLLRSGAAA